MFDMTFPMRDTDRAGRGSARGTGGSDVVIGEEKEKGREWSTVSSTRVTIAPHFATNAFPNSDTTDR